MNGVAYATGETNGKYIFALLLPCGFQYKTPGRSYSADIENRVWAFMGGIARKQGFTAIKIGGIENHVHSLLSIPPSILASRAVKLLKGDSSFWIKREFEIDDFGWQDGYGIFTVSKSDIDRVVSYIERQRDHHRSRSFEDEYIELLKLHQIDYDEQYVFG